jgi:gliding motility-associated-like protein
MKTTAKTKILILLTIIFSFMITWNEAYASHSEGSDLTYKCLGGNQYELTVSFYRDCHGVNAPAAATINCSSITTNQNFTLTLQPVSGTGQEIPVVCSSALTECQGGTYPGVQEWVYKGTTTLSPATDWVFSFDLCCRNAAITTIVNPGGQNIHIESTLDNLNFPCNSSPVFSTKPVPFVCMNQMYTFNHGAYDPDGDFITYELVTPMNGPNSYITYIAPYTPTQPLTTSPAMVFDMLTGDIKMNPTMLEVTVLAVKIKQWRNNQLVGYVIRDIQLRTMSCSNTYPYISGISGTWAFMTNACVGTNLTFNIYAYDPDSAQTVTITWNNSITGATFTVTPPGQNSTGTFSWTPGINDIGTHCITITVTDDNCPINGSQTFSICLVVSGFSTSITTTNSNCNASNGTATALITGGTPPYNFHWLPCGCTGNPLHGLNAGTYTLIVTDAIGCSTVGSATVNNGGAPGNINMSSTPATCFGGNGGTATANANGGQGPYTYLWSNGDSTQTITGLAAGNYMVTVITALGCVKKDSVTVTQSAPLVTTVSSNDARCFGASNGSAVAAVTGGTPPYTYLWTPTTAATASATGLLSGNYFVTVTDANNCTDIQNVFIGQPASLTLSIFSMSNVTCYGGNNGTATIASYGGVAPYTFLWNTIPAQTTQTATGLSAGNYIVSVTDSNGCTKMIACNITQPAAISSTINSVPTPCYGSATGSAAVTPSGGSAPYTYLWIPTAAATATATGLSAGTYSVVITDMYGCSHINTTTISQPTALSGSISNIQNVSCNNSANGSATASANGGTAPYTFAWSNGQTTSVAAALSSGNYNVTITDAHGCSAIFLTTITQPSAMIVSVGKGDTICPGNSANISASTSGGTIPYTYFWQPNVGFGNSQTVSPSATTTYSAIVTDGHGCTSSAAVTITVYNNNFTVSANATPAICLGQTGTVSASTNGTYISYYYWSNNLGNSAGPYTVSPAATTTYSVTVVNVCGAKATATVTVIVHPLPQINIPPQTITECGRATLHFSDTSSANSGSTYLWNFGDGTSSSQSNPAHDYTQTGVYTVSVIITSLYGCSSSAQANCTLNVFPYPNANFTSDPPLKTSIINPDFHFFDQSTNATVWNWDFGDGGTSNLQNPYHKYAQTGVYTVKLVTLNAGGCIDSIIKTMEVKPEFTFYIPNTFTPNGDQINDIFTGKGMEIVEYEMQIFDRWGNKIFETNDLDNGWDGRARGGSEIAQQDVYVYMVKLRDFEGNEHTYNGNVNLVK